MTKTVKMKSNAPSPQKIEGIGIVHPGETFTAPEKLAKELEKSFFERTKEEKPEVKPEEKPEEKVKPERRGNK